MTQVNVTELGYFSLEQLCKYMLAFIGEEAALDLSERLLDVAEKYLSQFPLRSPVCHELELLGVTDYRQLTVDDKYKILYRYDDVVCAVYIMAFMRHRQSAEELLLSSILR